MRTILLNGATLGTLQSREGRVSRWAGVALLGFTALAATGCANGLLLYPSTSPIYSYARRKILKTDGGDVELWTLRSPRCADEEPQLFVLSFMGNADRAELWAFSESQSWPDFAVEIWAMNYPGYGGSTGPAELGRIPAAALAAFDELQNVAGEKPILVSGSSLGSAAALYVSAQRPASGAVLRNPPPLRSLILGRYGWWNLWIAAGIVACQIPSELDSIANAGKAGIPAVFLLAQNDEVVPPGYQEDVVDAYAGEKRQVPFQGGHNASLGTAAQAARDDAFRWLAWKALRRDHPPED